MSIKRRFYLPGLGSRRTQTIAAMIRKRRETWLQQCPLSCDPTCCIHPPFVERYAVQMFSIVPNLDTKQMPKEQDQVPMRKICTLIKSIVSRLPNHHSRYRQDREKHLTLLTPTRCQHCPHSYTLKWLTKSSRRKWLAANHLNILTIWVIFYVIRCLFILS